MIPIEATHSTTLNPPAYELALLLHDLAVICHYIGRGIQTLFARRSGLCELRCLINAFTEFSMTLQPFQRHGACCNREQAKSMAFRWAFCSGSSDNIYTRYLLFYEITVALTSVGLRFSDTTGIRN